MRIMGLKPGVIAVAAFCVTSQAYAPPLNMATGPLCPPDAAGDCCQAHPEPGCDDPACCELVCTVFILCCIEGFEWVQNCADAAAELCKICQPIVGSPLNMATGPDPNVDGYLRVGADEYGSYVSRTFDVAGLGDTYNPAGGFGPLEANFSNGFMIFVDSFPQDGIFDARELLCDYTSWQGIPCAAGQIGDDTTLIRAVLIPNDPSDSNDDGVVDTLNSSFEVVGVVPPVNLHVDLEQEVKSVPGNSIALLTQEYTFQNLGPTPVTFNLVRIGDFDLVYVGGFADDSVGTDRAVTNNTVFQQEDGTPVTRITMVSAQATDYTGAKRGITPPGGPPAYGFGTDCVEWDAFGLPGSWADHIAGVGTKTNGESGALPAGCIPDCDAHIDLNIPVVELDPGDSIKITIRHLYGETCREDCEALPNGEVGIGDFLKVLADWGNASACDFDGGGVDVVDFLKVLAEWGACP